MWLPQSGSGNKAMCAFLLPTELPASYPSPDNPGLKVNRISYVVVGTGTYVLHTKWLLMQILAPKANKSYGFGCGLNLWDPDSIQAPENLNSVVHVHLKISEN